MSAGVVHCALACLLVGSTAVEAYFTVPEVEITAHKPSGLRAYIRHVPGVTSFSFHAKKNSPIENTDDGDFGGEVDAHDTAGRWLFEDLDIKLAEGDKIHYWISVRYNNLGYRKNNLTFVVKKLLAQGTLPQITSSSNPGDHSITTKNNGIPTKKGELIFEDNFNHNQLHLQKWRPEVRFPANDMEAEFVTYRNTKQNIHVSDGNLKITPTYSLKDDEAFTVAELDLGTECTSLNKIYCKRAPSSFDIISPITSGKVTTKDHFSFKYGKIEIRAKLPRGDWIFPILYLEPKQKRYGQKGYASGLMRIAFSRGNNNIFLDTKKQIGNSRLDGGVLLGRSETCRAQGTKTTKAGKSWGNDYHTYGLIWNQNSITLTVDGKEYGSVSPPQGGFKALKDCETTNSPTLTKIMAPFDEEFYISLGVGVGGVLDFPDINEKPWKNKNPKSLLDFWTNRKEIYSGWIANQISLLVDSVKVWAAD